MTRTTQARHAHLGRVTSTWQSWLQGNRAYGEAFEKWAHPVSQKR